MSPNNSLVGTRAGDPTNKSVVEDNFKDNDSLHDVKKKPKHRIVKPALGQKILVHPQHDPDLD